MVSDRNGAAQWVVAIKGTYRIHPDGRPQLLEADEQTPVNYAPEHLGDALTTGLRHECDLDYLRQRTDVLLHGHAHAPGGRPVNQIDVSLQVGPIAKTLRVFGDRTWRRGIAGPETGSPEPCTKMPIVWERAYGGCDTQSADPGEHGYEPRNPVGTGFATDSSRVLGQRVANVELPGQLISGWKNRPVPAGFGPVARHWSPRRELAGTYDERWEKERLPLLPHDFNELFFQCAPSDQQVDGYLCGDEPVLLRNLSPEGDISFRLPTETFVLRTLMGGQWIERRPDLHEVTLLPDERKLVMLWKSVLPCHAHRLTLDRTFIQHKRRVRVSAEVAAEVAS